MEPFCNAASELAALLRHPEVAEMIKSFHKSDRSENALGEIFGRNGDIITGLRQMGDNLHK